jgi:hypothetical protein
VIRTARCWRAFVGDAAGQTTPALASACVCARATMFCEKTRGSLATHSLCLLVCCAAGPREGGLKNVDENGRREWGEDGETEGGGRRTRNWPVGTIRSGLETIDRNRPCLRSNSKKKMIRHATATTTHALHFARRHTHRISEPNPNPMQNARAAAAANDLAVVVVVVVVLFFLLTLTRAGRARPRPGGPSSPHFRWSSTPAPAPGVGRREWRGRTRKHIVDVLSKATKVVGDCLPPWRPC